jgi:hypothetical protein
VKRKGLQGVSGFSGIQIIVDELSDFFASYTIWIVYNTDISKTLRSFKAIELPNNRHSAILQKARIARRIEGTNKTATGQKMEREACQIPSTDHNALTCGDVSLHLKACIMGHYS